MVRKHGWKVKRCFFINHTTRHKAVYVHCMNHRLNLCVADTCSLQLVRSMWTIVRTISDFFNNSPKREQCLKAKVRELLPDYNDTVLIDVCRTRWIARLDGMD